MFKNFRTIRLFYKLSNVKPLLIFLQFFLLLIPSILSVWSPILLSRTITAITVYDFNLAVTQIILEFGIVVISAFIYFFYHLVSRKVNRIIITNFQNYVYHNVKNNDKINSINISILKDINTCTNFNKNIIYKFCFFIKSIIILIIICTYNYFLSLIIILVSIISFFLLKLSDKKIQYHTRVLNEYELSSVELFNSICGASSAETSYNLEYALKDKYFKYVEANIKTSNSISLLYNINNNFISLILKSTVFASTLFLISQIRSTELTLSVYLILTPYLTSSAENLISFFDIFSEIALMNNILNNFESLKYINSKHEETPIEIKSYNLYFYNVSTNDKLQIQNLNLKINYKQLVCFIGDEDFKIDAIFKLMTKKIIPSSGCIFFGDKNISDFDSSSFNKYIASVTPNEQFFNISIYENLYLVCPSRTKIFKDIKNMGISDLINSHPEKYNTIINNNISTKDKFFLGIARAYLSGAKVINIYKLPANLTLSDKTLFKNLLNFLKKHCTIVCYFNDLCFQDIFDDIYNLNNKNIMNNLSKIANNNNRNLKGDVL